MPVCPGEGTRQGIKEAVVLFSCLPLLSPSAEQRAWMAEKTLSSQIGLFPLVSWLLRTKKEKN